jgi:hypothetical protein
MTCAAARKSAGPIFLSKTQVGCWVMPDTGDLDGVLLGKERDN